MIAGFIQARTESQRCSNKMLRPFADTSLIELALTKFTKPQNSFSLYFTAYEEELKLIGRKYSSPMIPRSKESTESEEEHLLITNKF